METKELKTEFFPLIFNSIPYGIFTVDAQGIITAFNHVAEETMGYKGEEVIGKPCNEVFRSNMCSLNCPLKRSISSGKRIEASETTVITKSGRKIPIELSTAAYVDSNGVIIGGVEMFRDISLVSELKKQVHHSYVCEDIVSKSPLMHRIFETLPAIALSRSTVVIEGESGTGKELVARAIHNLSPHHDEPFIAINCSALPENLLESELFGYVRGAFTDAKKDKPGRFALAGSGTILLDEISELSPAMQVKLLRVLQEREFEPLGATYSVQFKARIIACTNRDLTSEVKKRRFRKDLFFRLNVVRITLPALKDRTEDIPLLAQHFIDRFNVLQGRRLKKCSERVLATFMRYPFPGNIRELENAIEHAFVVCTSTIIQFEDLPPHILESVSELGDPVKDFDNNKEQSPLQNAEADVLSKALIENNWNKRQTAQSLNISRSTLWRKMKRYKLYPDN
jgi:PAS domain S-box-containing protein